MKGNLIKSFQFRMLWYTILSLLLAVLTECLLLTAMYALKDITTEQPKRAVNHQMVEPKSDKREAVLYEMVKKPKASFVGFLLVLLVMGTALFAFYFLIFTRSYVKSLQYIKQKILSLSQGNLDDKLEVRGDDEIWVIAQQINSMADELQKLMEMERTMERQKNELITSVTHDLRTPLTSIIGYLELLRQRENLSEKQLADYIEITYSKSQRLQKLIEDLFQFTKLDSGEIVLHTMRLDMVKLMEQMLEEFYPIFADAKLTYEWNCNVDSAIVEADGELMARAMENLLSNAVRYGKDGKKIRIQLTVKADWIWISIINYGILITKENLEHIFERFYRAEGSRNQHTGGTGLGLNIVQKIVNLHGGKIDVDSGTQGTRFRVAFPMATA